MALPEQGTPAYRECEVRVVRKLQDVGLDIAQQSGILPKRVFIMAFDSQTAERFTSHAELDYQANNIGHLQAKLNIPIFHPIKSTISASTVGEVLVHNDPGVPFLCDTAVFLQLEEEAIIYMEAEDNPDHKFVELPSGETLEVYVDSVK